MNNSEYLTKYLRKCRTDGLNQKSIFLTNHIITHFVEWCDSNNKRLESFNEDDIFDYLDYLDNYRFTQKGVVKQYSEVTKQRNKLQVRKFLKFVEPGIADIIKVKKVKNNKHPDSIFTKNEIEKLISACQNERDRALIATLYESGARKGELLSVRLKHITFDEHGVIMNIPEGKTGSRRIRLVYASSFLHQWLDCHPLKDNRDAVLFCSLRAPFNRISDTGLFDQLREIAGRVKIPLDKVYVHNFRHTRATHLSEHLTEAQLKEYLGWTKASTMTAVYTHLSGKEIDNAILKLNNIKVDEQVKDPLAVGRCPRCKELNPEKFSFCGKCGLPLSDTEGKKLETESALVSQEILLTMLNDPEFQKIITKIISEKNSRK